MWLGSWRAQCAYRPSATILRIAGKSDAAWCEHHEIVNKNDEFCINNDEFCIKNDEFCIQNDEFCIKQQSKSAKEGRPFHVSLLYKNKVSSIENEVVFNRKWRLFNDTSMENEDSSIENWWVFAGTQIALEWVKMMNFVFKTKKVVVKTSKFVVKMMNFAVRGCHESYTSRQFTQIQDPSCLMQSPSF